MEKNAKIVVTGGTGLIGSYLLRYLLHEGYTNIIALKRANSSMQLLSDSEIDSIEWMEADIRDILDIEPAIKGADYVYHCAGLVSFLPRDKDQLMAINYKGTANIVDLCLIHGIKKMVYTSSVAAIGRPSKDQRIKETTQWEKHTNLTQYAISKHLGEMEVWRGNAEGLTTVILNPSTVLGSGNWASGPQKLFNLVWSSFKYYPDGSTGFVDVRDVARLHLIAMNSPIKNQRFIISGEHIFFRELMNKIADYLGTQPPTKQINKWFQEVLWRVERIKSKITKKDPFLTKETVMMTNQSREYLNQKSIDAFNFSYTLITDTLMEMAEQFKQAKKEKTSYSRLPLN